MGLELTWMGIRLVEYQGRPPLRLRGYRLCGLGGGESGSPILCVGLFSLLSRAQGCLLHARSSLGPRAIRCAIDVVWTKPTPTSSNARYTLSTVRTSLVTIFVPRIGFDIVLHRQNKLLARRFRCLDRGSLGECRPVWSNPLAGGYSFATDRCYFMS